MRKIPKIEKRSIIVGIGVSLPRDKACVSDFLSSASTIVILASLYVGRQELERSVEWMSIMANLPCKLLRLPSIMLQSHH